MTTNGRLNEQEREREREMIDDKEMTRQIFHQSGVSGVLGGKLNFLWIIYFTFQGILSRSPSPLVKKAHIVNTGFVASALLYCQKMICAIFTTYFTTKICLITAHSAATYIGSVLPWNSNHRLNPRFVCKNNGQKLAPVFIQQTYF